MGGGSQPPDRGQPGGIAEEPAHYAAFVDAANAVGLGADWKPLLGLKPKDQGTVIDRVLARRVMRLAIAARERESKRNGR